MDSSLFFQWLQAQRRRDDEVGCLAMFAEAEMRWPRQSDNKAELRAFLRTQGAEEQVKPLAVAFKEFEAVQNAQTAGRPDRAKLPRTAPVRPRYSAPADSTDEDSEVSGPFGEYYGGVRKCQDCGSFIVSVGTPWGEFVETHCGSFQEAFEEFERTKQAVAVCDPIDVSAHAAHAYFQSKEDNNPLFLCDYASVGEYRTIHPDNSPMPLTHLKLVNSALAARLQNFGVRVFSRYVRAGEYLAWLEKTGLKDEVGTRTSFILTLPESRDLQFSADRPEFFDEEEEDAEECNCAACRGEGDSPFEEKELLDLAGEAVIPWIELGRPSEKKLRSLAKRGNAKAQTVLGVTEIIDGYHAEGRTILEQAAKAGVPEAAAALVCFWLQESSWTNARAAAISPAGKNFPSLLPKVMGKQLGMRLGLEDKRKIAKAQSETADFLAANPKLDTGELELNAAENLFILGESEPCLNLCRIAAAKGHPEATVTLADLLFSMDKEKDGERVVGEGARKGDWRCQTVAAIRHFERTGYKRSRRGNSTAAKHFEALHKGAKMGFRSALPTLARCFFLGCGTEVDKPAAIRISLLLMLISEGDELGDAVSLFAEVGERTEPSKYFKRNSPEMQSAIQWVYDSAKLYRTPENKELAAAVWLAYSEL